MVITAIIIPDPTLLEVTRITIGVVVVVGIMGTRIISQGEELPGSVDHSQEAIEEVTAFPVEDKAI